MGVPAGVRSPACARCHWNPSTFRSHCNVWPRLLQPKVSICSRVRFSKGGSPYGAENDLDAVEERLSRLEAAMESAPVRADRDAAATTAAVRRAATTALADELRSATPRLLRLLGIATGAAGREALWSYFSIGIERCDDRMIQFALDLSVDESSAS